MEEREADSGIGAGKPLDDTDFANANAIDISTNGDNDELENSIEHDEGGFEGDIHLDEDQAATLPNGTEEHLRSAVNDSRAKWPKSGSNVHIPYVISSSYSTIERARLARAFKEYESKTCIRYEIV